MAKSRKKRNEKKDFQKVKFKAGKTKQLAKAAANRVITTNPHVEKRAVKLDARVKNLPQRFENIDHYNKTSKIKVKDLVLKLRGNDQSEACLNTILKIISENLRGNKISLENHIVLLINNLAWLLVNDHSSVVRESIKIINFIISKCEEENNLKLLIPVKKLIICQAAANLSHVSTRGLKDCIDMLSKLIRIERTQLEKNPAHEIENEDHWFLVAKCVIALISRRIYRKGKEITALYLRREWSEHAAKLLIDIYECVMIADIQEARDPLKGFATFPDIFPNISFLDTPRRS